MENFEMSLIKDILNRYNIVYDKECKMVSVNHPISVADFIYLKQLLRVSTLEIEDIRVGDAK